MSPLTQGLNYRSACDIVDPHQKLFWTLGRPCCFGSLDLTSLRLVYLNHNRLMSLEPWWYYRLILGNDTLSSHYSGQILSECLLQLPNLQDKNEGPHNYSL